MNTGTALSYWFAGEIQRDVVVTGEPFVDAGVEYVPARDVQGLEDAWPTRCLTPVGAAEPPACQSPEALACQAQGLAAW